jgi:hypothetical protein
MKKTQAGFSMVEALIIVAVISAIGFTGWLVMHARKDAVNKSQPAATKTEDKKPAGAPTIKEYVNDEYGFTFEYPAEWDITEDLKELGRGHKEGSVTVISRNNTRISFKPNLGGKGGDCIDKLTNDHSTRVCSTVEILSVETLTGGLATQPLYYLTGSITSSELEGSKKTYFIDIQSRTGDMAPVQGTFLTPVYLVAQIYSPKFSPGYVDIDISVPAADNTTEKFYDHAETKAAIQVLKSFKLLQ